MRIAQGRGHPVPGPRPPITGFRKSPVEERRAGAVEAGLLMGGACLQPVMGVSGGEAVVVRGVAQLGGWGEADQGPGPPHHLAALLTEGAVDGAAVVGVVAGVVTRESAATPIQSKNSKYQECVIFVATP